MDIVQMSISASVLIMAVVMIRALTLHKLPKKTFLFLWGIVLCRLLVPFSIPFRFSFYTGVDKVMSLLAERTALSPTRVITDPGTIPIPDVGGTTGIGTSAVTILPFGVVWLSGLFVCALFFIIAYIKCRREFKMSLPVEDDFSVHWLREHPLCRPVQIRQSDRIKAPLTYGVFRPVILLPKGTDWTDTVKLRYVLTHEFTHIQRFDALTKLVLAAAVCVHWFNPVVWVMYVLVNRDIELSCDETVVRIFGETMKSSYALTLLELEEKKGHNAPLVNYFGKNAIEERIISIMNIKKISLAGILLALALAIGTTTVFATSASANNTTKTKPSSVKTLDRQVNAETVSESFNMMSVVNETDGKTYYSWDEGKTWTPMTADEYEAMFPTPDVEWWTYDTYKAWLDTEKTNLHDMIGERCWLPSRGWFVWTQDDSDEAVRLYEQILEEIKNGVKVSKSVNGEDNAVISYDPQDIEMGTGNHEYSISILLDNGKEAYFGPYSSKEELLAVVKPYCMEQVKAGHMTQQEADEVIAKYQ